jgi:hypothetical protein
MSITNSSMTGSSLSRCSSDTLSEVSIFIFHNGGHMDLKDEMNLLLRAGSPPPKVIPPPVA